MWIVIFLLLPLNGIAHELGHALYYLLARIRINVFVLFNMLIYRSDDKWKVKRLPAIKQSLVIPLIDESKSLEYYQRHVLNELLAGPIMTALLIVLWACLLTMAEDSITKLAILTNIGMNGSLLFSCFRRNESAIGDITAFFWLGKNRTKLNCYILDYCMLSKKMCNEYEQFFDLDFDALDDNEKADWSFDCSALWTNGFHVKTDEKMLQYMMARLHYKADFQKLLENPEEIGSIYTEYFKYTMKQTKTEQNLMNIILYELGIGDGMNEK